MDKQQAALEIKIAAAEKLYAEVLLLSVLLELFCVSSSNMKMS